MKVTKINDIEKFFGVVDSCKGKVELVTGEGDRLNLKSKLSSPRISTSLLILWLMHKRKEF